MRDKKTITLISSRRGVSVYVFGACLWCFDVCGFLGVCLLISFPFVSPRRCVYMRTRVVVVYERRRVCGTSGFTSVLEH